MKNTNYYNYVISGMYYHISGLFAIFHDGDSYFRIKNVPDNKESRQLLYDLGFGQLN